MLLRLLSLTLLLTYILIVLGASVRVFDAGMACPDWPMCYGLLVPFPESSVPGGYVVNGTHYTTAQVLLEWGHRLLAKVVGWLLLAITVLSFLPHYRPQRLWPLALLACGVLAVQVKLGGVTVWFHNIPWSVALHLGNAMLFFGVLVWFRRRAALAIIADAPVGANLPHAGPHAALLYGAYGAFAACVWLTMSVGATVSSAHAGGVCGGLLSCAGEWHPSDPLQLLHMGHRLLGVVVMVASVGLLVLTRYAAPTLRRTAVGLHVLMWGQVALGVLTLYSFQYYPGWYQVLSVGHLAWGTLLWMACIGALLRVRYGDAGRFHAPA